MARIQMQTAKNMTMEDCFKLFLSVTAAKGVKDKTLETYRNHFKSISKRLNVTSFIHLLTRKQLDEMILLMRSEHLSDRSINSYTRTLRVFLTWCNGEGYTSVTVPVFKASESVKETYADEELALLLEKPKANCNFCEYRNWAIVNFLINSGCRAATVRNIQIKDVDLPHRQITLRHTKNGKVQVIPLCSAMTTILRDYMAIRGGAGSDYLFCNEFGDFLSENGLRLAIARYNQNRGVQKTSLHMFRHSFARKFLVDCGGDAFTLQKLMGHSTLRMTKHYCNIFDSDIIETYDQFSPLAQMTSSRKTIKK